MIRFCFTNLDVGYSKSKCPAARSEQALVTWHPCTSDLCPPYAQQEPPQCCSPGWCGTELGMLEGWWMGKWGWLLCFPLVWGLLEGAGRSKGRGKAELSPNWAVFLGRRWKQIPGKQELGIAGSYWAQGDPSVWKWLCDRWVMHDWLSQWMDKYHGYRLGKVL